MTRTAARASTALTPLGVYFGFPEDKYHADPALGSTDMKRLAASPAGFWWDSRMNPAFQEEELTDALRIGRARHTIVLDGEEVFKQKYARKYFNWSTKEGIAEKGRFALNGLLPLNEKEWTRTLATGRIIHANPYLAEAFSEPVAKEVSIFWEARGIRRKARIDALKTRATVDLKNISNERDINFPTACLRYMHNYNAHVQAEHYREARLALPGLKAFGNHDATLLREVVQADEWAFVFVFVQSSGAPISHAYQLSYRRAGNREEMNPIFNAGRALIDRAEDNYRRCMDTFGTDAAWIETKEIAELDADQMGLPSWFLRPTQWESV